MTALPCDGLFTSSQVIADPGGAGWPYAPCIAPLTYRQAIITNEPASSVGRRPHLSRNRIAGRVMTVLITYWIDAGNKGFVMPADCITYTM